MVLKRLRNPWGRDERSAFDSSIFLQNLGAKHPAYRSDMIGA